MIKYSNIIVKELVEDWCDKKGMIAEDQLSIHFDQLEINEAEVLDAKDHGTFLMFNITCSKWKSPRELGLSEKGSLFGNYH